VVTLAKDPDCRNNESVMIRAQARSHAERPVSQDYAEDQVASQADTCGAEWMSSDLMLLIMVPGLLEYVHNHLPGRVRPQSMIEYQVRTEMEWHGQYLLCHEY